MKSETILIAEDDHIIADAIRLFLETKGLRIVMAETGREALELLEKEKPKILLLDLLMPDLDGFAVLQTLHDQKSRIPVIVITNLARENDEKRIHSLGVTDYIIKSDLSLENLWEKMEGYLE